MWLFSFVKSACIQNMENNRWGKLRKKNFERLVINMLKVLSVVKYKSGRIAGYVCTNGFKVVAVSKGWLLKFLRNNHKCENAYIYKYKGKDSIKVKDDVEQEILPFSKSDIPSAMNNSKVLKNATSMIARRKAVEVGMYQKGYWAWHAEVSNEVLSEDNILLLNGMFKHFEGIVKIWDEPVMRETTLLMFRVGTEVKTIDLLAEDEFVVSNKLKDFVMEIKRVGGNWNKLYNDILQLCDSWKKTVKYYGHLGNSLTLNEFNKRTGNRRTMLEIHTDNYRADPLTTFVDLNGIKFSKVYTGKNSDKPTKPIGDIVGISFQHHLGEVYNIYMTDDFGSAFDIRISGLTGHIHAEMKRRYRLYEQSSGEEFVSSIITMKNGETCYIMRRPGPIEPYVHIRDSKFNCVAESKVMFCRYYDKATGHELGVIAIGQDGRTRYEYSDGIDGLIKYREETDEIEILSALDLQVYPEFELSKHIKIREIKPVM